MVYLHIREPEAGTHDDCVHPKANKTQPWFQTLVEMETAPLASFKYPSLVTAHSSEQDAETSKEGKKENMGAGQVAREEQNSEFGSVLCKQPLPLAI